MDNKKGLLLLLFAAFAVTTVGATNNGGGPIEYANEYEEFSSYCDYILKKWESQYINNADEESKYAIVKEYYPNEDIRNMTLTRAKEIIYADYWRKIRASEVNRKIRLVYFDAAINQGQPTAVRMLQRLTGVTVDGIAGAVTVTASLAVTSYQYSNARYDRYDEVVRVNPSKSQYLAGWRNRLHDVQLLQIALEGE